MEATDQIDRLIESRAKGRKEANAEAALERAADRRQREAYLQECRVLWAAHYRRLAACNLKSARDYRRRARKIENGEA